MQEICNNAIEVDPWFLPNVPDHLKTLEVYNKVVEEDLCTLKFVPDPLKIQKMCKRATEKDPYALEYVSMDLITQEMCDKTVRVCSCFLIYVPEHYVMLQEMWWRTRKDQKGKIQEELLPTAWHPSR